MSEKEKIPLTIFVDEQTKKDFDSLAKEENQKKMGFGGALLQKGIQFFKAEKEEEQV
jgi:hypothetical protein